MVKSTKIKKLYHLDANGKPISIYDGAQGDETSSYTWVDYETAFGPALLVFELSGTNDFLLAGLGFPANNSANKLAGEDEADFLKTFAPAKIIPANKLDKVQAIKIQAILSDMDQNIYPPLSLSGTVFQHRVWHALMGLAQGTSTYYKTLAACLDSAPIAVGGAVGANPVSWLVPCHRVLSSDNMLHGYRWGLGLKAKMLTAEGVSFLE